MTEIPYMAPIFIKQYQICLYIKELLIIWDSKFLTVYLLIERTYLIMLRNSNVFKKDSLFELFYTLEQYFQYYNTQYIIHSINFILLYSRYKFLVDIRYCIIFCIVFFLTVLYDNAIVHNSKGTHTHTHIYIGTWPLTFSISQGSLRYLLQITWTWINFWL